MKSAFEINIEFEIFKAETYKKLAKIHKESKLEGALELYERLLVNPIPEYERKCTSSVSWVDIDVLKDLAKAILKDIKENGVRI